MGKPNRPEIVAKLRVLFEEKGYVGAGMTEISAATGLGRGSLYHLFPQGKAQMLREALQVAQTDFTVAVLTPLENGDIPAMFDGIRRFFADGEKQSLWGRLIHEGQTEEFAVEIRQHYDTWRAALTKALLNVGIERGKAASLSERTLSGVEGTLVLAGGFDDSGALWRGLRTMNAEIVAAVPEAVKTVKTKPKSGLKPASETASRKPSKPRKSAKTR